ncbi:prostaglandin E synthase isoform X2 [Lissotriton helveticus]
MENRVFCCFAFYGAALVLKMYLLAVLTGQLRLRRKAFLNPEDAMRHGGLEFVREDPEVERTRRCHHNDMENIYPFLFLGAVYSLLEPNLTVARIHFLVFFVARMFHTVAYLLAFKAPMRSASYTIAQVPCFSMGLQILYAMAPYL